MKRIIHISCILTSLIIIIFACSNSRKNKTLVIATAANMQLPMAEIAKQFSENTGIECELVISSSGKLTAQIIEGAPYDVFVAANIKYAEEIYNSGFAAIPPEIYACGKLVLWSMYENIAPSIELLTTDKIEHIALANPKTAPYGVATIGVLNHYNIYDKLKNKLVFGESIAQTNQFITSRAAEVGFTALSVVLSPEMKGKGSWLEIDISAYSHIEQGIIVIQRDSRENKAAIEFYKYIFSDDAQKTLMHFGYSFHE